MATLDPEKETGIEDPLAPSTFVFPSLHSSTTVAIEFCDRVLKSECNLIVYSLTFAVLFVVSLVSHIHRMQSLFHQKKQAPSSNLGANRAVFDIPPSNYS